jgi:hypothetical protein
LIFLAKISKVIPGLLSSTTKIFLWPVL